MDYVTPYAPDILGSGPEWSAFTASWWNDGVAASWPLGSDGVPLTGSGWSAVNAVYYIDSAETDLPKSGTGLETVYSDPADFFVAGVPTEGALNSSGTGTWNGHPYVNGVRTDIPTGGLYIDLLAHWKLNEESGTRADSHGSYDLTDSGSVGYSAGKLGNAADFDGGNYLSVPSFDLGGIFSVSFWFTAATLPSNGLLLSQRSGFCVGIYDDGTIYFGDMVSWGCFSAVGLVSAGTWYHVAIVSDAGLGTLYLNGTAVATETTNLLSIDTGLTFVVNSNLYPCAAKEDSISVWDRAISEPEVAQLYNSGAGLDYEDFGPVVPPVVGTDILFSGFPNSTNIFGAAMLAA
ncbi:MAG: LamG domain-containing protein [Verrucomicrobiales bacterium]|nr:MAG: LamG domain-containing protein [Verrucomicrobiales bacterium]